MNIKTYDADIYYLCKKPTKRKYKNEEGKVYFHPHLVITASEWARTKKVYALFREQIKKHLNVEIEDDSTVFQKYILILLEHLAREMKITGTGIKFVIKSMLPLPKSEWLKSKKEGK